MTILPRIDHDPIRVPIHSLELSYHIWYGKVDGAIHVGRNRHHLQIIWLFKFTIFVINKTIPGAQKNFRFSEVVSFSLREGFKKKVWNFPYFSGVGGFENVIFH